MANSSLAITNQVVGHPDASMAKIAQVLSIVVLILWALGILFYVLMIGVAISAESSGY